MYPHCSIYIYIYIYTHIHILQYDMFIRLYVISYVHTYVTVIANYTDHLLIYIIMIIIIIIIIGAPRNIRVCSRPVFIARYISVA